MADKLPGVKFNYPDGGLNVQRPADTGASVLVVGSAEDGPKNEAVPVHSLERLSDIFGRFGEGSLVRGAYEVWGATTETVDVRAMRIGNGARASLGIREKDGAYTRDFTSNASGIADATYAVSGEATMIDALTLTAKYEGSRYNEFTMRVGVDRNASSSNYGRTCAIVYNPFTGVESTYSFDYFNTDNTAVDVRNVNELVDAINADTNLNPYISASTTDMKAQYEVTLSGTIGGAYVVPSSGAFPYNEAAGVVGASGQGYYQDDMVRDVTGPCMSLIGGPAVQTQWNSDGTLKKTTIYLHHITTFGDNNSDGIPDTIIAPDPLYGEGSVIKVGPIGMTWSQNIATAGNQVISLNKVYEVALASGEILETAGKDFATFDSTPINRNESQSAGSVVGSTIINAEGVGRNTSQYRQYVTQGYVGTSSDGTTSVFNFVARLEPDLSVYRNGVGTGVVVSPPDADHDTWPGKLLRCRVYETTAGVTTETRRPATLAWWDGTGTITYTSADNLPAAGTIITIDYSTVAGTLTEYDTRTAVEATRGSTNDFENYFVTGNEVYFGGPHDTDISVTYEYKRDYGIPGDVSVTNHNVGKIEFTNPNKQPGLRNPLGTRIGLDYSYRPEWIQPSGTESLAGGSNGTDMTTSELKTALKEGYEALENYDVDIIVPMDAHLDSYVEDYSDETGILEYQNAGFHTQLGDLLTILADNVGDTIGVIGVEPSSSNSLTDVNTWVKRLTVPNSNDKLRGANFMPVFANKYVQVVAAEVAMSAAKLGASTVDYYSDGATTYAGLISSLPAATATTNKYIGRSLIALKHRLSRKQLEDLIDMRYVPFKISPAIGPVVVKDVTAATPGSDYDRLTTLRIVKMVADLVRAVAEPFIGNPNTIERRNALGTAINNVLSSLTRGESQALRGYNYEINSSPTDQRLGNVYVDLDLVPVFCIDIIHVTVRLRNAL